MGNTSVPPLLNHKQQIQIVSNEDFRVDKSLTNSPPFCKTKFHKMMPISSLNDDFPEDEVAEEIDPDLKIKINSEIEEESNQITHQYSKQTYLIEQIKVKWNSFIKMKTTNFLKDYEIKREVGKGGFGSVYKVKSIYTGIYRAAKKIKKTDLVVTQHQKLFEEMAIMKSLDHPNIAKLFQVYDYKENYILIMELCEGGELFKKIISKTLNHSSIAKITKQIFSALNYMHKQGIVHRDIKPQNMLFEKGTNLIKIIDFGIATKIKPKQILHSRLGTAYYIAPQVLMKSYNQKCDIWSMGIILFMMLFCRPPFTGETQLEIMDSVLKDQVIYRDKQWNSIPKQCKILLTGLLKKKYHDRLSAEEAYGSAWLKDADQDERATQSTINIALQNIKNFGFRNKLEAVVYTYVVSQLLSNQEKKTLTDIFRMCDQDNDGVISKSQLKSLMFEKLKFKTQKFQTLMRLMDLDGSGSIDFTQFLVAAINPREYLNEQHYKKAFQYFDIDHSGEITIEEITQFLDQTKESEQSIKKLFKEVDLNGDGTISKEEFLKLFKHQKKENSEIKSSTQNSNRAKRMSSSRGVKDLKMRNSVDRSKKPSIKESQKSKMTNSSGRHSKLQSFQPNDK